MKAVSVGVDLGIGEPLDKALTKVLRSFDLGSESPFYRKRTLD